MIIDSEEIIYIAFSDKFAGLNILLLKSALPLKHFLSSQFYTQQIRIIEVSQTWILRILDVNLPSKRKISKGQLFIGPSWLFVHET